MVPFLGIGMSELVQYERLQRVKSVLAHVSSLHWSAVCDLYALSKALVWEWKGYKNGQVLLLPQQVNSPGGEDNSGPQINIAHCILESMLKHVYQQL